MRSIQLFGKKTTGWQVLPADAACFEQDALRAYELISRPRFRRIGKVPESRRRSKTEASFKTQGTLTDRPEPSGRLPVYQIACSSLLYFN